MHQENEQITSLLGDVSETRRVRQRSPG